MGRHRQVEGRHRTESEGKKDVVRPIEYLGVDLGQGYFFARPSSSVIGQSLPDKRQAEVAAVPLRSAKLAT